MLWIKLRGIEDPLTKWMSLLVVIRMLPELTGVNTLVMWSGRNPRLRGTIFFDCKAEIAYRHALSLK